MRLAILFIALIAAAATAGTVVTAKSVTWELRDSESHPISKGYTTYEECEAAGKATPREYLCIGRVKFTVVGVCDDVPPPAPVVINGFTERGTLDFHQCPDGPNGPQLYFTQTQPVRDPYPSCAWVDRPVKITECVGIVNPWWQPDSPDDSKLDDTADNGTAQTDQTPGPWIEGVDVDEKTGVAYKIGDPCPEAAGGNCYASPNTVTG